jgi:gas vesicle protein
MNRHRSEARFNANWLMAFFAGFLSGGLVGAGAMLLLAPPAGMHTRPRIQQEGVKLRHQTFESMEDARAEAGDRAYQFTAGVHKEVGELQQRAQDMLAEAGK